MNTTLPLKIEVERKHCSKCNRFFYPKIDDTTGLILFPKYCAFRDCHSPNWNKPKKHYFLKNKNLSHKRSHVMNHSIKIEPKKMTILEKYRLEKARNSPINSLEIAIENS